MKFVKTARDHWVSECGNYAIWIQSRPRECGAWWAAQYRDQRPWLTDTATKSYAKQVCVDHREQLRGAKES